MLTLFNLTYFMREKLLTILGFLLLIVLNNCTSNQVVTQTSEDKTVILKSESISEHKDVYDMFEGGTIKGNSSINIYGSSEGDIKIEKNAKLGIYGVAVGNIENYGELEIYGIQNGDIVNYSKVTISGIVNGQLFGEGFKINTGSVINGESQN